MTRRLGRKREHTVYLGHLEERARIAELRATRYGEALARIAILPDPDDLSDDAMFSGLAWAAGVAQAALDGSSEEQADD